MEREKVLPRWEAFGRSMRRTLRLRLKKYPPAQPFDPKNPPRLSRPRLAVKTYPVRIPDAVRGWVPSWRRLLTGLDEDAHGGWVCVGERVHAGVSYALPKNTLIVVCDPDPEPGKKRVRILRVGQGGRLVTEQDRVLRSASAFGTSVRGTMKRLLQKYPPPAGLEIVPLS